jgi:hypothetical protein
VRQVGYPPELYEDARSENIKYKMQNTVINILEYLTLFTIIETFQLMMILLTVKSELFKTIKNYVLSVKNWSMLYLFIYFNMDTNEELNP